MQGAYVSRCWGLTSHYGTGIISSVSHDINATDLKAGDAINGTIGNAAHIVLFNSNMSAGAMNLYECTTGNWDRVANTSRPFSDFNWYRCIRYDNIVENEDWYG